MQIFLNEFDFNSKISHLRRFFCKKNLFLCSFALSNFLFCAEQVYLDAMKMLRMHNYEKEIVQVSRFDGALNGLATVGDIAFTERQLDDFQRIIREFNWTRISNVPELATDSIYYYTAENVFPDRVEKFLFLENKFVETLYNDKNLPTLITTYSLNEEKTEKDKKISSASFLYDDKERILDEKFFSYDDNFSEHRAYKYLANISAPDMQYFENDVLISERKHKSDGNYSDFYYFEDDFSVEQVFVKSKRTHEYFRKNGELFRESDIENDPRFAEKFYSFDVKSEEKNESESTETEANENASSGESGQS